MTSERKNNESSRTDAFVLMSPPYFPVSPAQLPTWLADDALLILDLRPSAAYTSARLPRALSLAVPTTLLRRPLFSLDRLSAMLANADVRARFASWPSASRILVYDADSTSLPDSSIINALLGKFRTEGFTHDLAWIQGGFYAVVREASSLVDTRSLGTRIDDDDKNDASRLPTHSVLRPNRLPMAAFTLSSTTLSSYNMAPSLTQRLKPPGPLTTDMDAVFHNRPAFNPFFDVVRQNIELSHGITERIPLSLTHRVRHRIHDLPFCWLQDIVRRADPKVCPDGSLTDGSESEQIDPANMAQGAEILATQFYQIELAEQRRLMSILEHHSRETEKNDISGTSSFPFSIVAGIEKGEKNRYRHIWPFEHARVRLHHKRGSGDDYINASYVQPLGTSRRYIATQGPLPATFQDFWMLCWEQNVHVIVMLTREVEGAMVKCGAYWTDSAFGPFRLRLLSTTGELPTDNVDNNIGYFAPQPSSALETRSPNGSSSHNRQSATIKRVFELTHVDYPQVKPRRVTHFQFLEWPDMNVPDDPQGVLELIKEVDKAVEETQETRAPVSGGDGTSPLLCDMPHAGLDERTGIAKHAMGKNSPVLLHCSAGVGRTGGFIAVDAILDAIKRGVRKGKQQQVNRLTRDSCLNSKNKASTPYFCATRQGGDLRQSDINAVAAESGGSSSSSVLPACSDSSSSEDSFEFDPNARFCGRYEAKTPQTSQPVRNQPKVAVSVGPLCAVNGQTNGNSSTKHNAKSLVSANGHTQGRSLSRQLVVTSDEESPSRSFSPSADESEPHLFDGQRKELTSSNSPPSSFPLPSANLKKPRKLHEDTSPIELGTFTEPIWEVVQDMREQRMSLCQSLRQYVFIHAAIVEGALMIVDEERRREKTEGHTTLRQISPKITCRFSHEPTAIANKGRAVGLSVRSNGLASAILTGKRVASPTELPKENKQGQVLLSKRPSLQRAKSP
ncbi:hypothetical protein JOM56_006261 [Amanita muscaria]